jgi:hypothetical protein
MRGSAGAARQGKSWARRGELRHRREAGRAEGRARAVARRAGCVPRQAALHGLLAAREKAERRGHEGGCARKKGSEARRKKAHMCT